MARDVFHPVVAEHWRSTMLLSYIVLLHFLQPAWTKNHQHRPIFAGSSYSASWSKKSRFKIVLNPWINLSTLFILARDTLWLCQNSY